MAHATSDNAFKDSLGELDRIEVFFGKLARGAAVVGVVGFDALDLPLRFVER